MPNTKQAKKRLETDEVRRLRNKAIRTNMRNAMKRVLKAESKEAADAALPKAASRIDRAAKHNIIHSNAAARFKSRLARRVAALG
jgi:small subunit ribosomal protein S20